MEDNIIRKLINKINNKLAKRDKTYPSANEYAFSSEEIKNISKENKQKISELKQNFFTNKVPKQPKEIIEETLSPVEGITKIESNLSLEELEEQPKEEFKEPVSEEEQSIEPQEENNSFINLTDTNKKIIMDKWSSIDIKQIDKDIMNGKELLNHNYTITYADESLEYIKRIRKSYEIVLCYLIGFNNEKKGIPNKTIFSNQIEDEWKYLNNYIKVLEKIRSFKK